jgi:hypothetical protein
VCIRQGVTSRILQRIFTETAQANNDTQYNYQCIIASLKSILKINKIDLGNVVGNYSAPLEGYAHKLMDLRNSDKTITLDVYNAILDIEKEMIKTAMVLEREGKSSGPV